jgi:hypothetical protein
MSFPFLICESFQKKKAYILILDIGKEIKVNNKTINIFKLKEEERKKYFFLI